MANPKSAAWYGGNIGSIIGAQPSAGDVFYVSGTGVDTNDGSLERPYILDHCDHARDSVGE